MSSKKKKQAAPNAYLIFMREFQEMQRNQGRNYTMEECAVHCSDLWAKLPLEERAYYQHQADDAKNRLRNGKLNSKGEALQKIHQFHVSEEMKLREMNEEIEFSVQCLDTKTLLSKVFHVIHINYFCKTDRGVFYPAEIALAEFTLNDGIIRVVHSFIDSGELPKGYRSTAMEHCNATHRTPLDLKVGNKILKSIRVEDTVELIMETLQAGPGMGELPRLYTMPDEVNTILNESCVLSVLGELCRITKKPENTFKVYNLPKLFYELRNKARSDTFPSVALALSELEKDVFKYTNGIACPYHEEEDVTSYCSKSIVQRWVYMICDHVCKDLGVRMLPGFHCPRNADLHGSSRSRVFSTSDKANVKTSALKENRSTNYVPQKEPQIREPHFSRASSYYDSDATSVNSSMMGAKDSDSPCQWRMPAEEEGRSQWRGAAAPAPAPAPQQRGWSNAASTKGAAVPQFDNLDDFPSIGGAAAPKPKPSANENRWGARGRGRHLSDDLKDMRLE